jgi:hypothetical protein
MVSEVSTTTTQHIPNFGERFVEHVKDGTHFACQKISSFYAVAKEKTIEVAKKIAPIALKIFYILANLGLFLTNSSLYVVGAIAASIFPKEMKAGIDRISKVFWQDRTVLELAGIGICAFIAWPIFLASTAFFAGGNLALSLKEPEPQPDTLSQPNTRSI